MVKIDTNEIIKKVQSWSDNEFIANATFKLDHWNEEVQKIIKEELINRNISSELLIKVEIEEKNKTIVQDGLKYYGIKGWLLVFVIILLINIVSILPKFIEELLKNDFDYTIIIELIFLIFNSLTSITIIMKKKLAIKLSKLLLYTAIISIILINIFNTILNGISIILFFSAISICVCLLWLNYFNKSKRVIYTLIK